jgi:hypothetical protein
LGTSNNDGIGKKLEGDEEAGCESPEKYDTIQEFPMPHIVRTCPNWQTK